MPHLQGKTLFHKFQHVEPIIVPKLPKLILDRYNNFTLCCNHMHINGIVFLRNISRHILFTTGIMIKNRKLKSIEYGISQVNKLYLLCGFNIICIHADSELNHYVHKWLILVYPSILCPRSNITLDFTVQY